MSDLRHSGKSVQAPSIAFRFHAGEEELEELLTETTEPDVTPDINEPDSSLLKDVSPMKEYLNKFGKRASMDNNQTLDSQTNSSETWRKINEFKGKITKTFEGKILEMTDRKNDKKLNSKDNSISDSEENSESFRDPESQSPKRRKTEIKNIVKLSDIKISQATVEEEYDADKDEIESGVEINEEFSEKQTETLGNLPPNENNDINSDSLLKTIIKKIYNNSNWFYTFTAVIVLLLAPVSDFYRGFLLGTVFVLILVSLTNMLQLWTTADSNVLMKGPFQVPDYKSLPKLCIQIENQTGVWFNEYNSDYDPETYSVSRTVPVYMELHYNILKLSYPNFKVNKRATYDEAEYKLEFKHEKTYNIRNCRVLLLPNGLAKRRLWSKKYPIVIKLNQESHLTERQVKDNKYEDVILGNEDEKTENDADEISEEHDVTYNDETYSDVINNDDDKIGGVSSGGQKYLNLFARCDREKEHWYRKLLSASKNQNSPGTESDSRLTPVAPASPEEDGEQDKNLEPDTRSTTPIEHVDVEQIELAEYVRQMARFIDSAGLSVDWEATNKIKTVIVNVKKIKTRTSPARRKMNKKAKHDEAQKSAGVSFKESPAADDPAANSNTALLQNAVKPAEDGKETAEDIDKELLSVQWFNVFVNRVLFDMLRSEYWVDKIRYKIQKKLSSLRLPYYVEEVTLTDMDLGTVGPCFRRMSQPVLDDRGVWLDMDVTYEGYTSLTIVTKLNLVKLQKGYTEDEAAEHHQQSTSEEKKQEKTNDKVKLGDEALKSAIFDSEAEDSAESSSDEESLSQEQVPYTPNPGRRSSKRLFRYVEHVAQSKYFQQVAQTKYIQKAIVGVSRTELKLKVEVKGLVGTLVVNIPPPPSDRFWYGFRGMPKLWLSAHPIVGKRSLSFLHVTNWIEKKLIQEFQKLLVMPNMDDLILPTASYTLTNQAVQQQEQNSESCEQVLT